MAPKIHKSGGLGGHSSPVYTLSLTFNLLMSVEVVQSFPFTDRKVEAHRQSESLKLPLGVEGPYQYLEVLGLGSSIKSDNPELQDSFSYQGTRKTGA